MIFAARALVLLALAAGAAHAQATILGTVFDSLRSRGPLAGATVVIPELSRYATADLAGRFRFDSVPAGSYSLTFLHPLLDSLDISAEILPLTVPARGTINARLTTPSPAALVALVCRAAADSTPAMMLGHVRDLADSSSIVDATVTVSWSELVMGVNSLEQRRVHAEARTRPNGAYVLCGLPNDLAMTATVTAGTRSTGTLLVAPVGEYLIRRDFSVSRRDSAGGTVTGTVHDARGRPIVGVLVTVSGSDLNTRTDEAGAFSIAGVPAGTQRIETRRTGWWPDGSDVTVPAGGSLRVDLALGRRDPALTAVPVMRIGGSAVTTGFEERRAAGIGKFVTRADIVKAKATTLGDVFSLVPTLFASGSRRLPVAKMNARNGEDCTPNYYLNGFPWRPIVRGHGQREVEETLEIEDIVGVEVYMPGAIPPIFDRANRCGSIIIWTS